MKAIILAAGFATRLYPLTTDTPKALLEIQGVSIIQDVFDQILSLFPQQHDVGLITNHHYSQTFQDWLQHHDFHKHVHLVDNGVTTPETRLGAIGDLLYIVNELAWTNDDLLVVASDTLTSLRLQDMVYSFTTEKTVVNAVIDLHDKRRIAHRYGCVVLQGSHIVSFEEKPAIPRSTFVSIPFYIFPAQTQKLIQQYRDEKHSLDAPGSLLAWLTNHLPIVAQIEKDGYYYDVGTPEDLTKLQASGIHHISQAAI